MAKSVSNNYAQNMLISCPQMADCYTDLTLACLTLITNSKGLQLQVVLLSDVPQALDSLIDST